MTHKPANRLRLFTLAILLLSTAMAACRSSETVRHVDEPDSHLVDERQESLEELYWSRINASKTNFTDADVEFMTDMIIHHAQAVIMSRIAPERDAGRAVQALAGRILNAQEDEIRTMQNWLRDRERPVPEIGIDGLIMTVEMRPPDRGRDIHLTESARQETAQTHGDHSGHGHVRDGGQESSAATGHVTRDDDAHHHDMHDHDSHGHESHQEISHHDMHHHDMPGMLTQEQLNRLGAAAGEEFDRLFLRYMIEHHEGAVFMVNSLLRSEGAAQDPETFQLASDIYADQVMEIRRMQLLLDRLENN